MKLVIPYRPSLIYDNECMTMIESSNPKKRNPEGRKQTKIVKRAKFRQLSHEIIVT